MSGKRKMGLLGGTFDPVHLGHLSIAEEARAQLGLDRVYFVPARVPWRKARGDLGDTLDRLAMVRLAVADNAAFQVSTVDLEREGPSYSVDTLIDLRRQLGEEAEFYFILGVDALMDLPHWRDPSRLVELAHLVAVQRGGFQVDWGLLERAIPAARERVVLLEAPEVGISSTEVRRRVAVGRSIRYWVPDAVAAYIREHELYRDASSA